MLRTDGVSLKPCSPRTKEDKEKPDPLGDPPPLPNNASHYNIGKPPVVNLQYRDVYPTY